MADISKINLSGAVYNIKDATARANLNEIQNISNAEIDEITDFVLESLPSSYVYGYETATAMQADLDLQKGMIVHTNGFTTSGDGNVAYYTISNSGTVNGSTILALQNGLKAIKVSENNSVVTANIQDSAITTTKIADGAVTNQKLASNAINAMPTMTTSSRGVAKVGAGLAMNGEALELDGNGDIATAVTSWLDAHPEATTTVEDGAITTAKLAAGAAFAAPVPFAPNQTQNLDELTTPGVYGLQYASSAGEWHASWPLHQVGMLLVATTQAGNVIYQSYLPYGTGEVYSRRYLASSGAWSNWAKYAPSNAEIVTQMLADGAVTAAKLAAGASFTAPVEYVANWSCNLDDLTTPGIYPFTTLTDSVRDISWPNVTSAVGVLIVAASPNGVLHQTFIEEYRSRIYTRTYASGTWRAWTTDQRKELGILFVGNSLTQDGVAYLPWLLKYYLPTVRFRIYMWYNGGKTLAQQYEYFVNDTPCSIFSVAENTDIWTNYRSADENGKTMSEILSTYDIDIVCMQEYFNYKNNYTDADLVDWENCCDYILSHYVTSGSKTPPEFVTLLHAPLRSKADAVYALTKSGCGLILRKTACTDIIPTGTAVYRALSTALDNLGDEGHLSPDGTHTQEGLPCLMQTWVVAKWLLDRMGIQWAFYGTTRRMNSTTYDAINVPGSNLGSGVVQGTTAENKLAQKVAMAALKEGKKLVADSLFVE